MEDEALEYQELAEDGMFSVFLFQLAIIINYSIFDYSLNQFFLLNAFVDYRKCHLG